MSRPATRDTSTWISLLLAAASSLLPARLFAQTPAAPRLVVPDVRDVTIRTRRTIDLPNSTIETEILFLKRAWQRREMLLQFPPAVVAGETHAHVSIARCDERRTIQLDPASRTFASTRIEDMLTHRRWRSAPAKDTAAAAGANVTITIDAADTGERRQAGPFTARRVITTTTTEAEPGANARAGTAVRDGWYIDLPPADCWDWGASSSFLAGSVVRAGSQPDRVRFVWRGTARSGFPIEETTRSDDGSRVGRVTLVEISETPLDDALFTVPDGYRAALPRLRGGFDMTKPDTLANRLASYWQEAAAWVQSTRRLLKTF